MKTNFSLFAVFRVIGLLLEPFFVEDAFGFLKTVGDNGVFHDTHFCQIIWQI